MRKLSKDILILYFNAPSTEFPIILRVCWEFWRCEKAEDAGRVLLKWNASQIRFYRGCWATGMLSVLSASVKRLWGQHKVCGDSICGMLYCVLGVVYKGSVWLWRRFFIDLDFYSGSFSSLFCLVFLMKLDRTSAFFFGVSLMWCMIWFFSEFLLKYLWEKYI